MSTMTTTDIKQFIEENIYEANVTYRGGTIKIDVSSLFPEIQDEQPIMGASQNYLGGGMLGKVTSGAMFNWMDLTKEHQELYKLIAEEAKKYLYRMTSEDGELEEMGLMDYEKNQKMPVSAY